jgi:hypothetical protein
MAAIAAPIVVDDAGDIMMFSSVAAAERALEVQDVQGGAYVGYDAEGRLLKLDTQKRTKKLLGLLEIAVDAVTIGLAEEQPTHSDVVLEKLLKHLSSVSPEIEVPEDVSLREVVRIFIERGFVSSV